MTEKLKHWCRGKETGTGASSGRRVHTHRESRPNQREIVQRRDTEHEADTFHEKRCNATQLLTPQSTTDDNKKSTPMKKAKTKKTTNTQTKKIQRHPVTNTSIDNRQQQEINTNKECQLCQTLFEYDSLYRVCHPRH